MGVAPLCLFKGQRRLPQENLLARYFVDRLGIESRQIHNCGASRNKDELITSEIRGQGSIIIKAMTRPKIDTVQKGEAHTLMPRLFLLVILFLHF